MNNWLKQEADTMEKLEKVESIGYRNAYIQCKQLLNQMSFYSLSSKCRVVRLEAIEDILNENIEYYERILKK